MVALTALLIPIVVSAVLVFIVSSILHMVLPYHRSDYGRFANEDQVMDFVRGLNLPAGDYFAPMPPVGAGMKDPAFQERAKRGPLVIMNVAPGDVGMGRALVQWFIFSLVVSFFAAYLASRFLAPDTHYLTVFRLVGTATFMGYGLALAQFSIWYRRSWVTTFKSMFDALIYGLLTAGVFGWLWPSA